MNDILEKNISELFGFSEMSDVEKAELLDDVGSVIMESAVLKFVAGSKKKEVQDFEKFLDAHENDDALIESILKEFPTFQEMLEEEIVAFKNEANEVLGS